MGFDENQSLFSANHAVKRISGVDCMELIGFKQIEYKPNIQYHTPSILGDMCGLSAIKINKILEEKGLQEESRDNKNRLIWVVTEKGKQYSRVFDTGKTNKAMAFNKNTIPMAILIVLGFAFITGEIAAMALPPQIAVPDVIRCPNFKFTFKSLVSNNPIDTVKKIENTVKPNPSLLVCNVSLISMPKPKPTTEIFRK